MDKKKMIAIGIAVLTVIVVVVVLIFAGGKDKGDTDTTTTEPTASVAILGYSAEVTENSLKVYKDEIFVQELTYPEDNEAEFTLTFAKNHISFLDMNFDGKEDICLTISKSETGFNYYCWLFDAGKGEFVYNKELSELKSITLDKEKKQIVSTVKDKNGKESFEIYEWSNNELKKVETKHELPETVTDKVLGSVTSNSTTSRPESSTQLSEQISGVLKPDGTQNSGGSSGNSGNSSNPVKPSKPGNNNNNSGGGIIIATENPNDIWYWGE